MGQIPTSHYYITHFLVVVTWFVVFNDVFHADIVVEHETLILKFTSNMRSLIKLDIR